MTKTLAEEIIVLVKDHANNNPAPVLCEVVKNYENDPTYVDVTTSDGTFTYVPCLFSNVVGSKGILVFINGNLEEPLAIIENRNI